jgi:hypothetical protein
MRPRYAPLLLAPLLLAGCLSPQSRGAPPLPFRSSLLNDESGDLLRGTAGDDSRVARSSRRRHLRRSKNRWRYRAVRRAKAFLGKRIPAAPTWVRRVLGRSLADLRTIACSRARSPRRADLVLFAAPSPLGARRVGVVISARAGRVRFAYRRAGRLQVGVMDRRRPTTRRFRGKIRNSYVRTKRHGDARGARYLAGELLLGYASP